MKRSILVDVILYNLACCQVTVVNKYGSVTLNVITWKISRRKTGCNRRLAIFPPLMPIYVLL